MAYGEFYVEHQGWARWPKTLVMCRKRGYETIERRRYVPERTCHRFWTGAEMICSSCAHQLNNGTARYCPNCGARVIGTEAGE